jgi:hypothetical protein
MIRKYSELLISVLFFLSFKSSCEIKETIISIIYNIIKNEKMIFGKENRYIEIINKYNILNYLIFIIEEEKNNKKIIICCLRCLLFICNNSYKKIIIFEEKNMIAILDKAIKWELNDLSILMNIKNKEELFKDLETVYFYIITLLFNSKTELLFRYYQKYFSFV